MRDGQRDWFGRSKYAMAEVDGRRDVACADQRDRHLSVVARILHPMSSSGYPTPEEAALAGFPPAAAPRLVDVVGRGDRAQIEFRVGPDYPDFVVCELVDGWWYAIRSGNGPNLAWFE